MRKYCGLVMIFCLILTLGACSIQSKYPEEGLWYCEELSMEIDFSLLKTDPKCVKWYAEDGSYTLCKCYIDFGDGIFIKSLDEETMYIRGSFRLRKDKFTVITDDTSRYIFQEK